MKNYILLFLLCISCQMIISCNQNSVVKQSSELIDRQIDSIKALYDIPAIAYGVIKNDTIILQNVIGFRDINLKNKVQINDLFHIGSNTKAITSFITAKIVEQNLITWDTKFFDLYPELKRESNPNYENFSLRELLSHKARLIPFKDEIYPITDYEKDLNKDLKLPDKRYHFIKQVLKYEPIPLYDHPDDRYSNAGYIAAALMLEKATGQAWEELINKMSIELKLGIYIGWPDDNNPESPKGHIKPKEWLLDIDEDLIPIPYASKKYHYFNQYILLCNPSGNLSISLPNFLEYLRLNINGLNGENNYLESETYKDIFYSYPDYSCGWMNENYFIPCFHHKGSASTFNSIAIIEPKKKVGIVIMMNVANGDAINEIAKLLIKKYAT
jgi:D-alanyl-D-alanine carboxypeptidase